MGRLEGSVALITGAARGQGRSHAVAFAREGADVITIDACRAIAAVEYPPATPAELDETVRLVEETGQRAVSYQIDVRDLDGLVGAATQGVEQLGSLDIVVANAGVVSWARLWEMPDEQWQEVIDINLTGVFHTLKATVPLMIDQGNGGSIVITSSVAGLKALPGQAHYTASKHALVGLTKAAAAELAPFGIRVNSIHPWVVDTYMGQRSDSMLRLIAENPTYTASLGRLLADPLAATCEDISASVLHLVDPASRWLTGLQLPIDAGATVV